ncbi:craniofacial development protein 2-like [Amphiura filiformis]|uniref:craniofacial development protein 2-like n=1 Tax=Amphiura filiformis TaxID=82378 RepID=UPI003B21A45B
MLYKRGKDNSSTGGVGFLIRKDLASNVVSYKNQSDRVAQVIIKISKRQTVKIIQAYLPTTSYPDEDVDAVYEEINELLNQDKANHTIIMGDLNAKVGKKTNSNETMLGKYGVGERNERGDRLLEFTESKNLKIMNTFFKKKESRKWTWRSPNGLYRNEIDFILTSEKKM